METETIIARAQAIHIDSPYDPGHDFNHHQAVFKNCLLIVESEGFQGSVNSSVLAIAAWWHDYKRDSLEENNKQVIEIMSECGATDEEISLALEAINAHSYGNSQPSLEAKILFDADKLEYVSLARLIAVTEATERGEMEAQRLERYRQLWKERIPQVRAMLNFETSRNLFDERSLNLKQVVESIPFWAEVAGVL